MSERSPSAAPAKTYPRPQGAAPSLWEPCPLCASPVGEGHREDCPWLLWAMWPADHSGHNVVSLPEALRDV